MDRDRRVASLNLLWAKRADNPLDWDRRGMTGGSADRPLTVGVRAGLVPAAHAARALGCDVLSASSNIHGSLRMLAAGRFDVLLGVQEEVQQGMAGAAWGTVVMMPRPLRRQDFYLAASPRLGANRQKLVSRWWSLIGQWRDRPEFNRD